MARKKDVPKKELSPKQRFFVRTGVYLRKNPVLAGAVGVVLMVMAFFLLKEKGVLFVIGFCLGMLSLTSFYIFLRGTLRKLH